MMPEATSKDFRTLKKGDYLLQHGIQATKLYFKVISVPRKRQGIMLGDTFKEGYKSSGRWFASYKWLNNYFPLSVIRKNSPESKGIEGKFTEDYFRNHYKPRSSRIFGHEMSA